MSALTRRDLADLQAFGRASGRLLDCGICGAPFGKECPPVSAGTLRRIEVPGISVLYLLCAKCNALSRDEKASALIRGAGPTLERSHLATAPAAGSA